MCGLIFAEFPGNFGFFSRPEKMNFSQVFTDINDNRTFARFLAAQSMPDIGRTAIPGGKESFY